MVLHLENGISCKMKLENKICQALFLKACFLKFQKIIISGSR